MSTPWRVPDTSASGVSQMWLMLAVNFLFQFSESIKNECYVLLVLLFFKHHLFISQILGSLQYRYQVRNWEPGIREVDSAPCSDSGLAGQADGSPHSVAIFVVPPCHGDVWQPEDACVGITPMERGERGKGCLFSRHCTWKSLRS